jgi:DNA-binding helix-hairpin-helix protein with protein kinase domain
MSYKTASGQRVTLGRKLGFGGEGEIFEVTSLPGTAFKKYLPCAFTRMSPAERTGGKVLAMAARPPQWREVGTGFVTMAWPSQAVLENGRFAGFLMPAVDTRHTVELHQVVNPSARRIATGDSAWARGFSWNYLVRTAANLAHVTQLLHGSGVVVGDFNERNILVSSQARVTLIDCDSMQVRAPNREVFFCRVGRHDFTPHELIGADWTRTLRHPSSDLFALAIHIYQLLMEGEHPFRGVWKGVGEKPPVLQLARQAIWTHQPGGPLWPRPVAVDFALLPGNIQDMFRRAFEGGAISPTRRPTAQEWFDALNGLALSVRQCRTRRSHFYPPHLRSCPWCERRSPSSGAPGFTQLYQPPTTLARTVRRFLYP